MNPVNIMLTEKSYTQLWNIIWFYICKIAETEKFTETESRLGISRQGVKKQNLLSNISYWISVLSDWKV